MKDSYSFPVARVGIIGGGQLARMMVKAAKQLGCSCVVLDPTPASPAGQVAGHQIVGDYHDADKLRELAASTDVLTYDLENVGTETLFELQREGAVIHPSPRVLTTLQDKLTQKRFFKEHGIPTADFIDAEAVDEVVFSDFGYPLVQKARRGGYDGRGVAVMREEADFANHLPVPSLLERFVTAEREIAVLVARGVDGETRCYPPVDMVFREGANVLDLLLAPADIDPALADRAQEIAVRTVQALDGVGVFGVEMFVTKDGEVLVNEVAPRTHNSGHHTIEACITDQFEQHIRAVLGLPLGATEQLRPAAMINLLGAPGYKGRGIIKGMAAALAIPGVCLHLYGKASTGPHRKMGHVTVLDEDLASARAKAEQVRDLIEIIGEEKL